jgi:flagellar M-ring protein FliF
MEQSLSKKIISLLEPYVGPGKVRADVKLRLNFDKVESTEETVDPESIAKVSEKSETSSTTGAARAGGIPGVSSNVAQATGSETGGGATTTPSKQKTESSLINYEVSKKITHLTKPVGEIQQLSVAVVIDDAVEAQIQDDKLITQTRKRTAEELDAIKKIAQAAVGFSTQRGDIIEVANLAFDTSAETISQHYFDEQKREKSSKFWLMTLPTVVIGSVLLLILIVTISKRFGTILKQARLPKAEEVEITGVDSQKLAALQEAKDEADIERELMEKYKIPKSTRKMGLIREKVKKFASENIEEAASLVKSFLIE